MNRRWLYGGLLVLATTMLVSTGSFSALSADRGVDVAVAEDENAYLGVTTPENPTGTVGENFTLLTISDNSGSDLELDSVNIDDQSPIELTSDPESFGAVTVSCNQSADDQNVDVVIEASSDGMTVDKTKTVSVSCESK